MPDDKPVCQPDAPVMEKRIEPEREGKKVGHPDCKYCEGWGWVRIFSPKFPPDGAIAECICMKRMRERRKAERYMALSGLTPIELAKWCFDTFSPERAVSTDRNRLAEIKQQMMEYAEHPRGWRVLCGPFGCGKTHLAYAVAAHRFAMGRAVYVATVPDLLDMLRAGYNSQADDFERRFETIKNVELLVLDDLGAQSDTLWVGEKLYQIINHRYAKELPLIITTNHDLRGRNCPIDGRILSRLLEGSDTGGAGMSRVVSIPAGDYRRQKTWEAGGNAA